MLMYQSDSRKQDEGWVVPCTSAPDQNIFDIHHQTSVNMVAEIFYSAASSILKHILQEKVISLL